MKDEASFSDPEFRKLATRLSTYVKDELRAAGYPPTAMLIVCAGMIAGVVKDPKNIPRVAAVIQDVAQELVTGKRVRT